jgi:hypothetical protein
MLRRRTRLELETLAYESLFLKVLRRGQNPSPTYISDVLSRFDSSWGTQISNFIANEVGEDRIKSIVSNRNRIAHGESVSMGVASLMQWAPAARKLCLEITRLAEDAWPS